MAHDVYICYDERDLEIAKTVCETVEDNGFECWLKNRDAGVENIVNEIMNAIHKTKVVILLYSKNSKDSNFVNNEVDEAFSHKRSILVYQIDDTKLEGSLEFFLRNKHWIKAYPDPEDKFDELIEDTTKLVKEQKAKDRSISNIVRQRKVPIIIGIVAILIVGAVLGYMMFNGGPGGTNATDVHVGDFNVSITDFHVDDVRNESTSWNYSYYVGGSISPTPNEGSGLVLVVDYYDETGALADTTETPIDEAQKVSSGFLFGSTVSDTNNIKRADAQLIGNDNVIIAQDESEI